MKKYIIIFTALVLSTILLINNNTEKNPEDELKIGLSVSMAGIYDNSFNQGAWEGIQEFEEYFNEFLINDVNVEYNSISIEYLEAVDESEQLPNLNSLASRNDIIIAAGYSFEDDIKKSANANQDTHYIFIDGEIDDIDNLLSISFKEEEIGYVVGVAAALNTKTNKVGFIGGAESPSVTSFGVGFVAGVLSVDDTIEIYFEYANTYDDVTKGKTIASTMYNQGVDIIFTAASGTGVGVVEEAKERAVNGEEVYVIGVDIDQFEDGIYDGENSVILTSAMKNVGQVIFDELEDFAYGNINYGIKNKGIKENGMSLPEKNPNLSDEDLEILDDVKDEIANDEIIIPKTHKELKEVTGYDV